MRESERRETVIQKRDTDTQTQTQTRRLSTLFSSTSIQPSKVTTRVPWKLSIVAWLTRQITPLANDNVVLAGLPFSSDTVRWTTRDRDPQTMTEKTEVETKQRETHKDSRARERWKRSRETQTRILRYLGRWKCWLWSIRPRVRLARPKEVGRTNGY